MPSSACQKCALDRKSTRLNSSHTIISYAVFCLKKKFVIHGQYLSLIEYYRIQHKKLHRQLHQKSEQELTSIAHLFYALLFFLKIGQPQKPSPFPSTPLSQ